MIKGEKASGYFSTIDVRSGLKVEGETRQCSHCQFTWQYKAGSGRRVGLCGSCNGLMCTQEACRTDQLRKIKLLELEDGKTYDCVPFDEWNYHLRMKAEKVKQSTGAKYGQDFVLNDNGILLRPD
ncbi:MAG TPA: hypothetical protein VLC46_26865 [Thermoanaerobaculia bacterium]|jgi:hypothetical protein|nr:hypothetical protein [Thermoanaerobaculia bacterium]